MPRGSIVIELSPSRLEVALVRSGSVYLSKSDRIAVNLEDLGPTLQTLAPMLGGMVGALGARGAQATMLYSSPSAAVGVFSCPKAAGPVRAGDAAMLALGEAADFPLAGNCSDLRTLAADKAGATGESQSHTLAIADTDAVVQALETFVRGAGVSPEAFIPVEAPMLALAVKRALELAQGNAVPVVLYLGEHASVLAAASNGRLKFARQIALGTEALVEAIARELVSTEGRSITPSPEQARGILIGVGIPTREQNIIDDPPIGGGIVLPLMQPALQRWVVEIRQSLRFGLDEEERKRAILHPFGPGTSVPRLVRIIADQLGLKPSQGSDAVPRWGAIDAWLGSAPVVALLPRRTADRRSAGRLRSAAAVGMAAAAALLATDTVLNRLELRERSADLKRDQARLSEAQTVISLRDSAMAEQAALAGARARSRAKVGETPAWEAAMAMLSTQTPPSIRLGDVQFQFEGGTPVVRLSGHLPITDQGEGKGALKAYMDSLSAVPIVRSCRLGTTQRNDTESGPVQTFEMTLSLVTFPADAAGDRETLTSAPAGEGSR